METPGELRAKVANLEARLADVMGEGGSYRRLQVDLDAALQRIKDRDAEIAALKAALAAK